MTEMSLFAAVSDTVGRVRSRCEGIGAMAMRSFGGFEPETVATMTEVLDAAFEKLKDTGEPDVVRERIAMRIMVAAKLLGERDPTRLLAAALRKSG